MMSKKHLKVNGYASARRVRATHVIACLLLLIPIIVFGYGDRDGKHIIKKRNEAKQRAAQVVEIETRNKAELAALRNMPALTNVAPTLSQIQAYLLQVQAYLESNSTNGIGRVVLDNAR
jgi:hypothetical protein